MQTVIGAFDTSAEAEKAAQDLVDMGVARDDISIVANNKEGQYAPITETTSEGSTVTGHAIGHDAKIGAEWGAGIGFLVGLTGFAIPGLGWIAGAGWLMGTILGAGTGAIIGGLTGALTHVGVPHTDAEHYTAAVQHGSVLIAVRASESQSPQVADILSSDGAINIDERVETYKQAGFLPTPATPMRTPAPIVEDTAALRTGADVNAKGEQVLNVVEESLEVGKREVQRGGVRVFSHVTERPVEENVNLHEEHVTVERHAVDRPANANAFNTTGEKVVEVVETAEVPVVAKEARVVEEVVVGKQATDRVETIHDTVRRTDVEVEQLPGGTVTTTEKAPY